MLTLMSQVLMRSTNSFFALGLAFSPDSQQMIVGVENHLLEFEVDSVQRRTFGYACAI